MEYSDAEKLQAFFKYIFDQSEGYLCIATINRVNDPNKKLFKEKFFLYPRQLPDAIKYANQYKLQRDVYYCPHLINNDEVRQKQYALMPNVLWSDVDDCPVEKLLIEPTLIIETSEGRTQALWKLDSPTVPQEAEAVNKRIAYFHSEQGMDNGGWDLTQLLRVPFTLNHKYTPPQKVTIIHSQPKNVYKLSEFTNAYPELEETGSNKELPFPEELPDLDAEGVIRLYQNKINPRALRFFQDEPSGSWSECLWQLELSLLESGLSMPEAFIVCREAACNKYARDNRPQADLWSDLVRAHKHVEAKDNPVTRDSLTYSVSPVATFSPLLRPEEHNFDKTIVEDYIEWAKTTGDASYQYHQAGAFIVLSTLLAGRVTLRLSFATIRPNLWFMILGDTTLTRKSTAMDLAVDMLTGIDPSALMATDGSIEGMLTQLSMRAGRPSLFLRDEFTGLLEMMQKRDYYAGMLEALTKLYDGRYQKRVLKNEEIEVKDPILNIFAGGIKEKTLDLLDERYVTSGFVPRFVFIMADTDLTRMKPVGPPTAEGIVERAKFTKKLKGLYDFYKNSGLDVETDGGKIKTAKTWEAELTPDAWRRYNIIENTMVTESIKSERQELITPCMDRMSKTGLKVAVIIAASKAVGKDKILVDEGDIVHAFHYIEQWREYTLTVVEGAGSGPRERSLERVYEYISKNGGASRTQIMRKFRFHGRQGDEVLGTLEDRGLVVRQKSEGGRAVHYKVMGV